MSCVRLLVFNIFKRFFLWYPHKFFNYVLELLSTKQFLSHWNIYSNIDKKTLQADGITPVELLKVKQ